MKDQLISLETAKLAKEKRFNIACKKLYKKDGDIESCNNEYGISYDKVSGKFNYKNKGYMFAPTQSLLQKWLRDNHNIHVDIYLNPLMDTRGKKKKGELYCVHLYYIDTQTTAKIVSETCSTYEEMLEIGLQKALELI